MKVPAIILAAGASRRLGRPKQLVEISGEYLIRRTALSVLAGCMPVLVILGAHVDRVRRSLVGLPVEIIVNKNWQEGISSSLRAGIEALPVDIEGVFFFVCDQIALDSTLVIRLIETQARYSESIIACEYAGIRGTPAYFPAKDFPKLRSLTGDHGAGVLLQSDSIVTVPFLKGGQDIDYPEDLSKYLKFDTF